MQDIHADFHDVSQSQSPEGIFRILDVVDLLPSAVAVKQKMLSVCPLKAGDRALDVGCGIGHEAVRLAQLVGPAGRVVGVDKSDVMVAEARRRTDPGLPIEYRVGEATQLEVEPGAYDFCRAERLLMYVDQPERVLAGLFRALRPGGRAVIFELDYDTSMVDGPDAALTMKMARLLGASVANGWVGRQLFRLFRQAGFQDVQSIIQDYQVDYAMYRRVVEGSFEAARARGAVSAEELQAYWRGLEARAGDFFTSVPGFIVTGRKP